MSAFHAEVEGPFGNLGYRLMRKHLRSVHNIDTRTETMRVVMAVCDPNGVRRRFRHVFRRRMYTNPGPNYIIHLDGWDKLKPFGISVHGAIDGFSRKMLWLESCPSNKDPSVIAQFFVDHIRNTGGVPVMVFAELGTENCHVRDIQRILRWNHNDQHNGMNSFRYTKSPHNQRM